MCEGHASLYREAVSKPIRGIERPEYADDSWRPSIADMMRHAEIAIAFAERDKRTKALSSMGRFRRPGDEKFTPAQLQQLRVLRGHLAQSLQDGSNK